MAEHDVEVLIVGAGPAGLVAACLLARQGLRVRVAERNPDFAREFRGEILQPRFHQAMMDVGLHDHLCGHPHERVEQAHFYYEGRSAGRVELTRVGASSETTWWMTQPTLLRALHEYAAQFPGYELCLDTRLRALRDGEATLERSGEQIPVAARVVVGADGRSSAVRRLAGIELAYDHHDFDVLWFELDRPSGYDHVFSFFVGRERSYLILPKHPDLLQCGLILRPGEYVQLKARGIETLRRELRRAHPLFEAFAERLESFSAFHPLRGNRACARAWSRDGLLLIGDAAHTCSPAGGIGVAIAAETACVAAGVIASALARNDVSGESLAAVRRARLAPVRRVHALQARIRLAVRLPAPVLALAPLAIRSAAATGVLPRVASLLLTQRGRLPLFALDRGRLYPDALRLSEGLARYFARSGFGRETYTARWVHITLGPFAVPFPNVGARRAAVPLHDVDHVVAEYEADLGGELEIAGYELGTGSGRYAFAWWINLQGLWLGLLRSPRRLWRGFLRGRRSGSVYRGLRYDDALLGRRIGDVRDQLGIAPRDGLRAGGADRLAFAGMLLLALVADLPLLLPIAYVIQRLLA